MTVEHVPDFAVEESAEPGRPSAAATTDPAAGTAGRRRPRRARAPLRAAVRPATRRCRAGAAPRVRASARLVVVPRRDPRRRRRRRGAERRQPDDRRRHLAGRVRRSQHRRPAAAHLGCADEAPHRPRPDARARLGRRAGHRPPRSRGEPRPDQARAARLRHGVRHRRRGRRHRHRRRAGRREDRARARRADGRHRDDAVPLRGNAPRARRHRASRSCAPRATR